MKMPFPRLQPIINEEKKGKKICETISNVVRSNNDIEPQR